MSISSATVFWEAVYQDGFVFREADGGKYGDIDRGNLRSFRLVSPGEVLAEVFATDGRSGWNLVYRRRTEMVPGGGRKVWFLMGFVPQGPLLAVQPETLQALRSDRFGKPPFDRVQPRLHEGEHWNDSHMLHRSDAVIAPQRITLPSGFQMKVGRG